MNILNVVTGFFQNNALVVLSTVLSMLGVWKVALFIWEKIKPIEKIGKYVEDWAFDKGRKFALFYKSRVPSQEFRDKTLKELSEASNRIQEAFVKGIESVS